MTPYQVTRHTKHVGAAEALSADVRAECRRRRLPEPRVTPLEPRGVPGVGLVGGARLTFEVAVEGPVVLGKSRHLGGPNSSCEANSPNTSARTLPHSAPPDGRPPPHPVYPTIR